MVQVFVGVRKFKWGFHSEERCLLLQLIALSSYMLQLHVLLLLWLVVLSLFVKKMVVVVLIVYAMTLHHMALLIQHAPKLISNVQILAKLHVVNHLIVNL